MEKKKERVEIVATVGEFGAEPGAVVPVDNSRLDRIKLADPDEHGAKFATVAVESGVSKNKRNWRPEVLTKIAEQIRAKEPVGYRGHPLLKKGFDKGADFPDPQTVWLGATTTSDAGKTKLFIKGYNLKDKPIRGELLSGAVDSVSICGDATMIPSAGGWDVEDFDLETIDWSRKGGQGMAGKVVALTGEQEEQEENSNDEGSDEIVKPEDIAALTAIDLKRHNPDLYSSIEEEAKKELAATVGEQKEELENSKPVVEEAQSAREKLGLKEGESLLDKITELISNAKAGLREEFKNHVTATLEKKLKGDANAPIRDLVAQLVGEMADDADVADEEGAQALAEKKVNEVLDSNESVKKLVGEMEEEGGNTKPDLRTRESHDSRENKRRSANLEISEEVIA